MNEADNAPRSVRRSRKDPASGRPTQVSVHGPIQDAVRPCLTAITYLAQRDPKPPLDVVYDHARSTLQRAKIRLDALPLEPVDLQDIYYALIAYIDEVLQAEPGPLKEFWQAHLLQLEHFGETRAGEGFFERLERVKSDGRVGVLRVYYVCLLLGFRGIYGQHGELERENLIVSVREVLGETEELLGTRKLSPFGARPDEPGADRRRNRLLQGLAFAAAAMAAMWYVGLLFVVDAQAKMLTDTLESAHADLRVVSTGQAEDERASRDDE